MLHVPSAAVCPCLPWVLVEKEALKELLPGFSAFAAEGAPLLSQAFPFSSPVFP